MFICWFEVEISTLKIDQFWKAFSLSRACISFALGSETQINSMQGRYNPNIPKQGFKSLGEPLYAIRHPHQTTRKYTHNNGFGEYIRLHQLLGCVM